MNRSEENIKKQRLLKKYFGWNNEAYSQFENTDAYKEILKLSYNTIFARIAFLRALTPDSSRLVLGDIDFILQREKGAGKQFKSSDIKQDAKDLALDHISALTESELNEFTQKEQKILLNIKNKGKIDNSELDKILKILFSPLISDKEDEPNKEHKTFELPTETKSLTIEEVAKLFDELTASIDSAPGTSHQGNGGESATMQDGLKEKFLEGVQAVLKRGDIKITGVKKSRSNVIYACFEPIVKDVDVLRYTIFESVAQKGHATYFVPNIMFEQLERNAEENGRLPRLDIMKKVGFSKNHELKNEEYSLNWFCALLDEFFKTLDTNRSSFNFDNLAKSIASQVSIEDINKDSLFSKMLIAFNWSPGDAIKFDTILKGLQSSDISKEEFAQANRPLCAEMLIKQFRLQTYAIQEAKKISNQIKRPNYNALNR